MCKDLLSSVVETDFFELIKSNFWATFGKLLKIFGATFERYPSNLCKSLSKRPFWWTIFRNTLSKFQRVHIFVKSRKVRNTAQSTKMADGIYPKLYIFNNWSQYRKKRTYLDFIFTHSLRSWQDFVRECFCFGSEAVRGLVKSRGFAARKFFAGEIWRPRPLTHPASYAG